MQQLCYDLQEPLFGYIGNAHWTKMLSIRRQCWAAWLAAPKARYDKGKVRASPSHWSRLQLLTMHCVGRAWVERIERPATRARSRRIYRQFD